MSQFIAYPKIHRLGKEETLGILSGEVTLQEKVDGANTSIWLGDDGKVHCGSRTRELDEESFNGFVEYVNAQEGIKQLLAEMPTAHLYGEWLVRHTVAYKETSYRHWYLFDVLLDDKWLTQAEVVALAGKYQILTPQIFKTGVVTEEEVLSFVGQTNLGDKGEGVVIKNPEFINQFGDFCYAKVVTQEFKEDNALTFGGNNKHSDTYQEMYVVNKYCTLARVQKIMNKIQPEINTPLDKEHTSRVVSTCYHDLITEEAWDIAGKVASLDFKILKGLCSRKFIKIYHDILEGHFSVAYQMKEVASA